MKDKQPYAAEVKMREEEAKEKDRRVAVHSVIIFAILKSRTNFI